MTKDKNGTENRPKWRPPNEDEDSVPMGHQHNHAPFRQRHPLERQIIHDFQQVMGSSINRIGPREILGQEQVVLWKFVRSLGVMEGIIASVVTFGGLNRFPRYWARRVARQQQQQTSGSLLEKLSKSPSPPMTTKSPFQTPTKITSKHRSNRFAANDDKLQRHAVIRSRNRFLFTAFELLFDISMSIGVGLGVSFLMGDKSLVQKSLTDIPLQPGRSLLSARLCPHLLEEYKRQWKYSDKKPSGGNHQSRRINNKNRNNQSADDTDDLKMPTRKDILQHPQTEAMQTILLMTENCRHRQVMEQQLRNAQGLPSSTLVSIPDTGVLPMTEDSLGTMMKEEHIDTSLLSSSDFDFPRSSSDGDGW